MNAGPILVTGARGFAGSHLVEELTGAGADVLAWDRVDVDLLDPVALRSALERARPAAICHCAGAPHVAQSWGDTASVLETNVIATSHLLGAVRDLLPGCRVLNIGSATVYRQTSDTLTEQHPLGPASPYAVSKLAQEMLADRMHRDDGLDVVQTRSFNHTGPRQQPAFAAPAFARQVAMIEAGLGEPVLRVGNLTARRDLTDVRDVARAYRLILERGVSGTVHNVCSGTTHAMQAIVDGLCARVAVPVRVEPDPARYRPNDTPVVVGSHARLTAATGWEPTIPFDRMLDDLLDYWRGRVRDEAERG
ncbi:MAG: GDP-mannose 4,6-dehydratase [Vicinamibacterales bacterium]